MAKRIKRVLCDCDNTLGLQGRPMDDALALLYLLGREEDVDLLGIACNFGNGTSAESHICNSVMLEETGYSVIPVLKGCEKNEDPVSDASRYICKMADKYPGISPYAYCAWNPVKLVDPDGREMFPTESAAAKVRANAVDMFGESRVGEIYNKGDEKHPNYAFLVYDYGKDKYERPSSKGVWAYKPDKCVDSKFDLFLYATFKAEKEWSFNGSFSIGGQCGVDVGCVNLGINISSIDLVGIDWDLGKGKVDTYHCEENNARGSRGVSLGLLTLAGQTYEGGDYIDEASKRTNVLGVGVGKSKGQWNITLGVTAILGIQISISSKIKK